MSGKIHGITQILKNYYIIPNFSENSFIMSNSQNGFLKKKQEFSGFLDDFFNENKIEYAVFSYVGEINPFFDMMHHIRNSFAHGRFTVKKINKEFYIFMEDINTTQEKFFIKARIILRKKNLLEWINIFECKSEKAKELCAKIKENKKI